jgi:hypothetical protein
MQAGFIGFGLLVNLGFVQKFIAAQRVFLPDVLLMLWLSENEILPMSKGIIQRGLYLVSFIWLALSS